MNDLRDYIGFNLRLSSQLPIPGAIEVEPAPAQADIEILFGAVPGCPPGLAVSRHDGAICLDVGGGVRFGCSPHRIVVDPGGQAGTAKVGALLIANALPACLWMRGDLVLHAMCVVPRGAECAVALCGGSGTGKSTLLAQMVRLGARAIADDTIRVTLAGDAPVVSGLPAGYWRKRRVEAARRTFFPIEAGSRLTSARLAALFIAVQGTGEPAFFPARMPGSFAAILSNRHRPAIPDLLGDSPRHMRTIAAMAAMPVYFWQRPHGVPTLTAEELSFFAQAALNNDRSPQ